jgi:hypothetical protein
MEGPGRERGKETGERQKDRKIARRQKKILKYTERTRVLLKTQHLAVF